MPHKRRKNKATSGESEFDLTPNERPTATGKSKKLKASKALKDDTPKDFLRLLERVKTGRRPNGLDDGNERGAKRRRTEQSNNNKGTNISGSLQSHTKEKPSKAVIAASYSGDPDLKIRPGESLRDFSARVDAAIPHVRAKSGVPHISHLKKIRKAEKRAQKLAAERAARGEKEEDDKINDSEAELSDDFDPEKDEVVPLPFDDGKKGKKRGRAKSPDPFEELKKKRGEVKFGEVVQAPPELIKVKELLRAPGARNVPKASGSLAKRETLGSERERIIAEYRKLMEGKRGENAL